MLRFVSRISLVAVVVVALCGCGWTPWGGARRRAAAQRAEAEARRAPLVLGRVSLVNEGERFALIEANLAQAPAAGTMLRIYSGSVVSAELRATGVQRRPFLVADLVSGLPAKGDLVVQPSTNETSPPRATAVTPAPAPSPAPASRWPRWSGFFRGRK